MSEPGRRADQTRDERLTRICCAVHIRRIRCSFAGVYAPLNAAASNKARGPRLPPVVVSAALVYRQAPMNHFYHEARDGTRARPHKRFAPGTLFVANVAPVVNRENDVQKPREIIGGRGDHRRV